MGFEENLQCVELLENELMVDVKLRFVNLALFDR